MAKDQDSPYAAPGLLLVLGAIIAGLGALGLTGDEGDEGGIPMPVAYVLFSIGGTLAYIGATAIAFVMATAHLRRR